MSTPRKKAAPGGAANDTTTKKGKRGNKKKGDDPELFRDSDIEKVKVEKEVIVAADTDECKRLGAEHAKVTLELSKLATEKAEYDTKYRKKTRELRKEDLRLAKAVDSKTTTRRISCYEVRDYKLNQLRYVDESGKEVSPPVVMPPEMRQKQLFDDAEGSGGAVDVEEEEEADDEGDDDAEE